MSSYTWRQFFSLFAYSFTLFPFASYSFTWPILSSTDGFIIFHHNVHVIVSVHRFWFSIYVSAYEMYNDSNYERTITLWESCLDEPTVEVLMNGQMIHTGAHDQQDVTDVHLNRHRHRRRQRNCSRWSTCVCCFFIIAIKKQACACVFYANSFEFKYCTLGERIIIHKYVYVYVHIAALLVSEIIRWKTKNINAYNDVFCVASAWYEIRLQKYFFLPFLNATSSIRKQIFSDPTGDFLHCSLVRVKRFRSKRDI